MIRPNTWKVLTLGVALTGLSFLGAAHAAAQPDVLAAGSVNVSTGVDAPASRSCTDGGGDTTHCQTNGSNQIHTSPDRKIAKPVHDYGPFFKQNRGRFGAGGGRGQ